jgi:23S rRNA (pseudouridine1915-N3)-methyltransferase
MQITILSVGKPLGMPLQATASDYIKRLQPYVEIDLQYIPQSNVSHGHDAVVRESKEILSRLQPNDTLILLDERGRQQNNIEFAETFQRLSGRQGKLVFVIGGAYGVDDKVFERAQFVWSLSKLVFPHQLMRVILLEQLYRTVMITKNHPYHHV